MSNGLPTFYPRARGAIIRDAEPYEAKTIAYLRENWPAIKDHTDDEIACIWTWFCVVDFMSGWCDVGVEALACFLSDKTEEQMHTAWKYA